MNILFIVCVGGGGVLCVANLATITKRTVINLRKINYLVFLQFYNFFYNTETVINITTYAEILLCVLVFCDMKMIVKKNKIK